MAFAVFVCSIYLIFEHIPIVVYI